MPERFHEFYLIRSDQGDGGWSLHTTEEWEACPHDDVPETLLSGESEQADGEWLRPNEEDLIEARLRAAVGRRED